MDYTKNFLDFTRGRDELERAVDFVRKNTSGKVWIIGGFVYRGIASQIYGTKFPDGKDFDFLSEKINHEIRQDGFEIGRNRFGSFKFKKEGVSIDLVEIRNLYSVVSRGVAPEISNYLTGVPLNIQSIAYDLDSNLIIGEVGASAIGERIVRVNDWHFAEYAAEKKGISVEEMIKKKAEELEFRTFYD